MIMTKQTEIINTRPAGQDHQVVTVVGGTSGYRRKPCKGCPWVIANTGSFPAEAFRHSAPTAYDMAQSKFGCHESGADRPATCAGFLLRNADNNMKIRLQKMRGDLDMGQVQDDGRPLHASYRAMAVANGVDPSDPVLRLCRDNQGDEVGA